MDAQEQDRGVRMHRMFFDDGPVPNVPWGMEQGWSLTKSRCRLVGAHLHFSSNFGADQLGGDEVERRSGGGAVFTKSDRHDHNQDDGEIRVKHAMRVEA